MARRTTNPALRIAAVGLLLAGCGPTASGGASPTAAPGPSLDVPPGWTRTLVPAFDGISGVGRIAAGPSGFVALSDFSAWHSSDGLAWLPVKQVGDQPRAILPPGSAGDRWIAGGWTTLPASGARPTPMTASCPAGPTATAQFSTSTDGLAWALVPDQPDFHGYVVGEMAVDPRGEGVWAVGANSCAEGLPPASMSWRSTDGTSWLPTPTEPTKGLMTGIAPVGGRLVAIGGSTDDPGEARADALAWTMDPATDRWSQPVVVAGAPPLGQAYGFGGSIWAIARTEEPQVWRSADGVTWTAMPMAGVGPRALVVVPAVAGPWLAAVARDGIYGLRADGTWVRLAGATDSIEALGATATTLVAIAQSSDGHGVVWRGPATAP